MDHVPEVADPVFPRVQVPCLSQQPYGNKEGSFGLYPHQRGWDTRLLKQGVFNEHSSEATAAFLQDWLFFGMLYEVLGDDGTKENFSRWDERSNQIIITTKNLKSFLKRRMRQIMDDLHLSPDGRTRATVDINRIEQALSILSAICNIGTALESASITPPRTQWPLTPEVDLSIRALGQLLATAVFSVNIGVSPAPSMTFPAGIFTSARMRKAGWCPSDIAMVTEYMSASSLYYASSLRRSQLHNDHSHCSRQLCIANQVDVATYQTAHWDDNCNCNHICVPVSKLIPIIAKNGIPLITISIAASGDPIIEISPYYEGQHYIALSHVWSDGMGNLRQNSLPRCQVLRLKALVDEMSWSKGMAWDNLNKAHFEKFWRRLKGRTVAFWLDTLCIPVGSEHQKYRSIAISLMYKTYVSAQNVLVLDSELQKTPIPADLTETFLRVSISGWMRRLWTLQEAVLGRRLQVKFHNGIVDVVTEYNRETDPSWHYFWKSDDHDSMLGLNYDTNFGSPAADCRSSYWAIRTLRFRIGEKKERKFMGTFTPPALEDDEEKISRECFAILDAFVSSNYRSSLRKADEHLCLSGLLGWDAECLNGVPVEQRMKTLLSKRTHFPQGLLFIAGPRMLEKGWRWALQSFGNDGSEQLRARLARRDGRPAKLCTKGLVVQYPGFIVPTSNRPTSLDHFFVEVPLFADKPPVVCRVRRHISTSDGITETDTVTSRENLAPTASLGLFFYCPTSVVAYNVPMGAIIVDMDEEINEDASGDLEGALACSYTYLAQIELFGHKDTLTPIYPDMSAPANIHSVSREDYGMKRWCVG